MSWYVIVFVVVALLGLVDVLTKSDKDWEEFLSDMERTNTW